MWTKYFSPVSTSLMKPKPFDSLKKSIVPLLSAGASSDSVLLETPISILSTSISILLEGSGGVLVKCPFSST